jgi:hypothetical protein
MNIAEFNQHYSVLLDIFSIVKMVQEITGKEIDFQLVDYVVEDNFMTIAKGDMTKHIVRVSTIEGTNYNYSIARECGGILRIMQTTPKKRLLPYSTFETISRAKEELDTFSPLIPLVIKKGIINYWEPVISYRISCYPFEVRVERWIFDTFKSLRKCQIAHLENVTRDCVDGLDIKIARITPPRYFHAFASMVYAYLKGLEPLMNADFSKHFVPFPEAIKLGEKLYRFLEYPDNGYQQDVQTAKQWGKILGLQKWTKWIAMENVQEGYGEVNDD